MSAPATRTQDGSTSSGRVAPTPLSARPRTVGAATVAPERVSGAQAVVRSLEELGVEVVFGLPGGCILPVYDPLLDSK